MVRTWVAVWLVTLEYAEGDRASYQVPVERRDHAVDHLSHALIGEDGGFHYDALHDKEVTGRWLRAIADDAEYDGPRFRHEPASTPFPWTSRRSSSAWSRATPR